MYDLLDGMSVVEGAAFIAAPLCGMTLAQLGAEVIRFDMIGGGPDYRRWPLTDGGQSLYWMGLNKGKKSIAVDFREAEGRELLTKLITRDGPGHGLFLTNFPMRGWLAHDALCEYRADLITAQITGSPDGRTAVDYTVNCAVGIPFATGQASADRPVNNMLPAWDISTGLTAAIGILAAERKRRDTGKGQLLTLALSDVAMAMTGNLGLLGEAEQNGVNRPSLGNDIYGAFGRDFASRDGRRVMIAAFTPKQCTGLIRAIGAEDAIGARAAKAGLDPATPDGLFQIRDTVADLIAEWCKARTLGEIADGLDAQGVCWGPY
ncbi:MAG: CoA transferase, partial [Alphaproteobacteria bacterium]|nr:CoA transferase [Alphaproteobacteria bacterium]